MLPTRRRKDIAVIESLLSEPGKYSFFQAVRIIERALLINYSSPEQHSRLQTIGGFAPPANEILQFRTKPSLSFPETEITHIESDSTNSSPVLCKIQTNFLSLAGSTGVLPYHYTEFILQRLKLKDSALSHFLDLFNHRLISLFYQANTKYNLPLEHERKQLKNQRSALTTPTSQILQSVLGMGTSGLSNRLSIKDDSLLFYSGLLSHKVRSAQGLKQILGDYFQLPVKIQEFVGQWQDLLPDFYTRLGSKALPRGQNACLGQSAMLGARGWIAQGKVRIVLGPLTRKQFEQFSPGTKALSTMNELVRFYLGFEHDYEFVIEVNRMDLPNRTQMGRSTSPIMGWNTWLSSTSNNPGKDARKTLKITVSSR